MHDKTSARFSAADGVYLVGGGALVASAFLYWVRRGPGNGLRGHEMVDTLINVGRNVPALSSARLTVLWYLIPAAGAACWIVCGLWGARSRPARITALVALAISTLTFVGFQRLIGFDGLGLGPLFAFGGGILVTVGAWAPRRVTMTPRAGSSVVRAGDS